MHIAKFFFSFGLLFSLLFLRLDSLELKRVILATDNNPTYIQFWPVAAPLWQEMGLRPTLALIADDKCEIDEMLGDVIRFPPLAGVPDWMHAQVIRLLLPVLFPEDGCIISDIDMLPISRSYYYEGAKNCPDKEFLVYRNSAYSPNEHKYPMCYFGGKGSVFSDVFKVSNRKEIGELIQEWAPLGHGWNTDETMLYKYVIEWEQKGGKVHRLNQGVGPRLDRLYWGSQMLRIDCEIGNYIDCHCPRPYANNVETINKVVKAIRTLWTNEGMKCQ